MDHRFVLKPNYFYRSIRVMVIPRGVMHVAEGQFHTHLVVTCFFFWGGGGGGREDWTLGLIEARGCPMKGRGKRSEA